MGIEDFKYHPEEKICLFTISKVDVRFGTSQIATAKPIRALKMRESCHTIKLYEIFVMT